MKHTVLHRLAESVARRSHSTAITGASANVSYSELEARSNQLANTLVSLGLGEGSLVAISLERSPDVLVAIIGVLKAGAAYVPLDPVNPDARLQLILSDASPGAVVTERSLAERFKGAPNLVVLDADARLASASTERPGVTVGPPSLAYVIYTSGTTGRPKGVMITHRNLDALLSAAQPFFEFGEADVWTLFHSYGFDVSVWEMWGALGFGGRLVVPDADTVRSPDTFYELLERERVTVLCQTPSAFHSILDLEDRGGHAALSLRYVILAGEPLDPRKLGSWFERRGDDTPRIVNMYGITETTIHTTYRRMTRADCVAEAWSPIGVPLPNSEIVLLDENGRGVPDGSIGEIHVLGDSVSRGYLQRPDLTAERFSDAPDGRRMYRSGDLARRTPEGDLNYQGRVDTQVQIRGFRVELGEIESALRRCPEVTDAVVRYAADRTGGKLIAYVVPVDGVALTDRSEHAIREAVAMRLPAYMIPTTYVAIGTIPLTANGKVDRAALPEPTNTVELSADPELSATERRIAGIWSSLLGLRQVDRATDFFAAGGHSLLAVEAMIRTQEEFGIEIPLGTMFEHTTLGEVADVVREMTAGTEELVI